MKPVKALEIENYEGGISPDVENTVEKTGTTGDD